MVDVKRGSGFFHRNQGYAVLVVALVLVYSPSAPVLAQEDYPAALENEDIESSFPEGLGSVGIHYVDQDDIGCSDEGPGTDTRPFCSIQEAFNRARPGRIIRIRESALPYEGSAKAAYSGTKEARIIVERDRGHRPVLRNRAAGQYAAAIEIIDKDYWTVRGLTFDGTGVETSLFAVLIRGKSGSITGNKVVNNTFVNWGGKESNVNVSPVEVTIARNSGEQHAAYRTRILRNTFIGNRGRAVNLTRQINGLVEDNTITRQRCGKRSFISPHTGEPVHTAVGIHVAESSFNRRSVTIRNNRIYDFAPGSDCSKRPQPAIGIWADVNGDNGEIYDNVIYGIIPSGQYKESAIGIMIEAHCDKWKVHHNLVYDIGGIGIRNGNEEKEGNGNTYEHNTLYRTGLFGFKLVKGRDLKVRHNIVAEASSAQIYLQQQAIAQGGHLIDFNSYYDSDGSLIGKFGTRPASGLSTWRNQCGCDGSSLEVNPGFSQ